MSSKVFVLAFLLAVAVFEDASAATDWRYATKISHMEHINSIVNDALSRIQNESNGTPAAKQCQENARVQLRSISLTGYSDVSTCVYSASTAGIANVCAQQVDSRVFQQALDATSAARACFKNT